MTTHTNKPIIGLIGTGVMGKSMAGHLINAGYEVHVYTRTQSKAQDLLERGAKWQASPGDLAAECQIIMTMVGFPSDVEEVYFGENGILARAQAGSYLIDFTTSSPSLAKLIYKEGLARQLFALDAPVSGGDIGAREARLSIMVGGSHEVFNEMLPIFKLMGTNIVHQGAAGAGQHTKMCNQIAIASNMMGVVEALVYAKKAGLNPSTVLQSIETGAAGSWSLSNLGPRMIADNFAPGFYVKHFIKDMKIALQSAEEMQVDLPGLKLAKSLYEQLAAMGEEESGTQALYKLINK
ncbi:NAD(P)-dependent oxidoreductase [Paenibacillus roseipurpureus]|uniref:NAD(P)-dependent oxidoreductase n=1 Tax=Paenibacillus roseopurpureus TaxID=2918901 RepID=A0AA96LMV9_9BACL|nr:NAD(P)-dependent oxidoreductase [Paenibacillus sp. MBLB1832]WNR42643.1 NAD(P)-dependent oxidoreductase [Paenibacillus sp. MBLB1832]